MRRRYPVLLAAVAAVLGSLAAAATIGLIATLTRLNEIFRGAQWSIETEQEVNRLTLLVTVLQEFVPDVFVATAIPLIALLVLVALLPVRRRADQAGSASVTASRDAARS